MLVFAKSDIGLIRQTNEDSYACILPEVFLVADGMGGHVAGEVASSLAVKAVSDYIQNHFTNGYNREVLLEQAIIEANELIFNMSKSRDDCAGMGTTISSVLLDGDTVYWGHVGDSRIYILSTDGLHQVTSDHSLVWELVQSGNITKEEAHSHPQRNMLTRAVGTSSQIKVDTGSTTWRPGDFILLCTDGLTNMIAEHEIERIILEDRDDGEKAVNMLVTAANQAGGHDNITAILLQNEGI